MKYNVHLFTILTSNSSVSWGAVTAESAKIAYSMLTRRITDYCKRKYVRDKFYLLLVVLTSTVNSPVWIIVSVAAFLHSVVNCLMLVPPVVANGRSAIDYKTYT